MATPLEFITTARYLLADVDDGVNATRQSNTELLGYFNDGVKELSNLKPEVFTSIGDILLTTGACEQVVTFLDAQAIIQVLCIHGGAALTPFDVAAMDAFSPAWRAATPAAPTQWSKYTGDPLRFFVYPPPLAATTVDVRYVCSPAALALTDIVTDIPAAYLPALVDYIVYRAESKDDEHVNSGRAASHYQSFVTKVKGV